MLSALPPRHLHLDVWLILGTLGFAYWYLSTRIRKNLRPVPPPPRRAQWISFYTGLGLVLAVSQWPMHDLAEQSLYSVHMVQHMVMTLIGPPLMLMGFTHQMADHLIGTRWILPVIRQVARPVTALLVFNLGMLATHWPEAVALSVHNELAHFLIHSFLFLSALAVWMPVVSPSTLIPKLRPPARMGYLFFNSILPTIPASFLTFSEVPVYPVYGDAALAFGMTAVTDQTVAGLIMKLGGTFLIWFIIAVIWFRWASEEARWDRIEQELRSLP